jgi:Mrp family chromosome partitioning ATPase
MNDLHGQMQGVWSAVAATTGGAGGAVMFIGARQTDGVSACARAFAELCARRATRPVWLLDLDLFAPGQFEALGASRGGWSGPFDMTFGQAPFWRASPRSPDGRQGEGVVVSYRAPDGLLFVSKGRREALLPGQSLQVAPAPNYWRAVRQAVEMTIVDAPPLERSRAGLAIAADMDGVVLVVDGEKGDARDAVEMRDEVLARGARLLGVVVVQGGRKRRLKGAA